jgi:hypothetical protein
MKRLLALVTLSLVAIVALAFAVESQKRRTETPNERFYRLGGKETKANVVLDRGALTTSSITQQRDLTLYDDGGHTNCRVGLVRYRGETDRDFGAELCQLSKLRDFVWEHWQSHKRGYVRVSFDSVDAVSTAHLFIEPGSDGKWHVAWRFARHNNTITDVPDIRSIRQRPAIGSDVECRCKVGDTVLSFLDSEGSEIEVL